jgi:prevent-host-death family protein
MTRVNLDQDIKTLSDFRSNVSRFIDQVHNTKRPIVITQHGKSAAVLLSVAAYERMVDTLEMIQDIETASNQIVEGKGISTKEAQARLRRRFQK